MILRPYQKACNDAVKEYLRLHTAPCIIDAAPAAGKSHMIADLSDWLYEISGGKRVLNLAPSKELVRQNYQKMLLTGHPASIFSASAGQKSTKNNIVFGTPLTVKNSISRFLSGYCAVNVDEAHGITPTIREIIEQMRVGNPNLRVIGWSGTPYRLGMGYVYREEPEGVALGDEFTRNPYFEKCVHRVSAREMLEQGFITPMIVSETGSESYEARELKPNKSGNFDAADLHAVFEGHGRLTSLIVADVVARSKDIPGGCMLFAATVEHAKEIMASLPPLNSAVVTGTYTFGLGRPMSHDDIIKAYREQRFKYLVSVGQLTTGFDVTHTSVIATLRKTESAALLEQILGRAWRLHEGKETTYWLDYASNLEEHFPDGDIYKPRIKTGSSTGEGQRIEVICPECDALNAFTIRKEIAEAGYEIDDNGYCLDLNGLRVMTDYGPMPAHYGRRCWGQVRTHQGWARCSYRWTGKDCRACGESNDISARYCSSCRAELVDPNEKLTMDFKALKRDPTVLQTDDIVSINTTEGVSSNGNETLRVDFVTTYRSFSVWFMPKSTRARRVKEFEDFMRAHKESIRTVTYRKDKESGFYSVFGYNMETDHQKYQDKLERIE